MYTHIAASYAYAGEAGFTGCNYNDLVNAGVAAVMTGYRAVGIEVTDAYYKLGSDRVKIALEAEQKEDEK